MSCMILHIKQGTNWWDKLIRIKMLAWCGINVLIEPDKGWTKSVRHKFNFFGNKFLWVEFTEFFCIYFFALRSEKCYLISKIWAPNVGLKETGKMGQISPTFCLGLNLKEHMSKEWSSFYLCECSFCFLKCSAGSICTYSDYPFVS